MHRQNAIALLMDMPEIVMYQKPKLYRVGDYLVPLSVEIIRKRYKIPGSNIYKTIEHFSPQSDANRLRIIEISTSKNNICLKVIEEYDDQELQKEMETKYPKQMIHTVYAQVCADVKSPNIISYDCLDSITMWVLSN